MPTGAMRNTLFFSRADMAKPPKGFFCSVVRPARGRTIDYVNYDTATV
jgi:hypothetical protein